MSKMVERVARAMCRSVDPDDTVGYRAHPSGIWLDEGEPYWRGYEDQARAAITAMREPTEAMLEAGQLDYACESFGEDVKVTLNARIAEKAYVAMIDAALTD